MTRLLIPASLVFLLSCQPADEKKIEIKNGNVPISYHLSGKGDTSIVLVHGWCIDKEYWKQQQEALSSAYKVVSVDLGGHGQSGHNRDNWTIGEYAKDVISVINGLDLKKVILVGHSMGGDVILQTSLSIPQKIIGFIGIDNFKDFVSRFTPQQEKEIGEFFQAMKSNFDTVASQYGSAALFPPGYKDTVSVNRVIRSIQDADSIVAIRSLESLMVYTLKDSALMSQLPIPVHLIASDFGPTNEEALRRICRSGYSVKYIKGTGHYPMIEKPAEFTALLKETIHQIGAGK